VDGLALAEHERVLATSRLLGFEPTQGKGTGRRGVDDLNDLGANRQIEAQTVAAYVLGFQGISAPFWSVTTAMDKPRPSRSSGPPEGSAR